MSPRHLSVRLLLPVAAVAVLTAACGGSSGSSAGGSPSTSASRSSPASASASAPASASEVPTITIKDFSYAVPASVSPGAKVSVANMDGEAHTVTVAGGGTVTVQGGAIAMLTAPPKAGKHALSCDFHGNMQGELVVA